MRRIKIDRSFVRDLAERPDCMAIIRAVAGLGASLGISTTAEGVETRAQLDRLRAEGCTEAQGFLFSPPRPSADIMSLLAIEKDRAKLREGQEKLPPLCDSFTRSKAGIADATV